MIQTPQSSVNVDDSAYHLGMKLMLLSADNLTTQHAGALLAHLTTDPASSTEDVGYAFIEPSEWIEKKSSIRSRIREASRY